MSRDEVEAAYFTLLRARDEVAALQRFGEYLGDETRRLQRFRTEGDALAAPLVGASRRALRHTEGPLQEAIDARLGAIRDLQQRLPDRLEAAERFVEECELAHERLRTG